MQLREYVTHKGLHHGCGRALLYYAKQNGWTERAHFLRRHAGGALRMRGARMGRGDDTWHAERMRGDELAWLTSDAWQREVTPAPTPAPDYTTHTATTNAAANDATVRVDQALRPVYDIFARLVSLLGGHGEPNIEWRRQTECVRPTDRTTPRTMGAHAAAACTSSATQHSTLSNHGNELDVGSADHDGVSATAAWIRAHAIAVPRSLAHTCPGSVQAARYVRTRSHALFAHKNLVRRLRSPCPCMRE